MISNLFQQNEKSVLDSLNKSLAIIEFTPDGTIITANNNFCSTFGYSSSEIRGKHHRLFVDPTFAASPDYSAFWARLKRGEF